MAEKSYADKPLLDKLGVRPGMRVALIGVDDAGFVNQMRTRTSDITLGEGIAEVDAIFVGVEEPADMKRLSELRERIKSNGAIWAIFRKGRKDFSENDVQRLGLESGLVDVKVVRFSETHTALKFVVQKRDRPKTR